MKLWVIALAATAIAGPALAHGPSEHNDYDRSFGIYTRPPADATARRAAAIRELHLGGEVPRLKQPFRPWKRWAANAGPHWQLSRRHDPPQGGGGLGGICR